MSECGIVKKKEKYWICFHCVSFVLSQNRAKTRPKQVKFADETCLVRKLATPSWPTRHV